MKLTRKSKTVILIVFLGLVLGILISQATIFTFLLMAMIIAITFGLTILVGIYDLITKNRYFVYPGLVTLCALIAVGFGLMGFKVTQYHKQQTADELIIELTNYKKDSGNYPHDLSELSIDKNLLMYNYRPDSTGESYELSFSWDGWHLKSFDSDTRNWTVND